MLALLLARQGVDVTLLEAHKDFDREFRGDTVHPSTLEILDEIGLAERLHEIRHVKAHALTVRTADGPFTPVDFRRLAVRFPYIMLIPQSKFLEFITAEAAKFPNFRLIMQANMDQLLEEGGATVGVRYQSPTGVHNVKAALTVGADGRFSRVRHLAGLEMIKTSPPMDALWFRLPRLPNDPDVTTGVMGGIGRGHILVILDRYDHWQVAYVIPKGAYQNVRAAGLDAFRNSIVGIEPRLKDHVAHLRDWHEISVLSVESGRCPCWSRSGLLLIGDAAHVMSPVGGVGINYAIQDAVVAANVLGSPLKSGRVETRHLAEVQRQREWPTKFIQAFQSMMQKSIIAPALHSEEILRVPAVLRLAVRLPVIRTLLPRIIGYGIKRVHFRPRPSSTT